MIAEHIFSFLWRLLKASKFLVDRATGLAGLPGDMQLKIEVLQMATRAKLGWAMAAVGEIVLGAITASFIQTAKPGLFYVCIIFVTICYAILASTSFYWNRIEDRFSIFNAFQRSYCALQFFLGLSWGGVIIAALPAANGAQKGQIYAVLIGLVSTPVFSGPAIYSLSFWVPVALLSITALAIPDAHTGLPTFCGIASYYILTFFSILSINRKLVDREINALRIMSHKEDTDLLLRDFEEGTGDWIWETDRDLVISRPSERFCAVAGRPADQMSHPLLGLLTSMGQSMNAIELANLDCLRNKLLARITFRDLVVPAVINGEIRWWELAGRPTIDTLSEFNGFRGVGRDITDMQRAREKVDFLATHDPLTKLFNRESFGTHLAEICKMSSGPNAALLCLDLDFFKAVNDKFGHGMGDAILVAVADRLRACVRHPDKAFRLGGDEFAVILRGSDQEQAVVIARRIVERIAQPFGINGVTIGLGACVGIAQIPLDTSFPELVHRNADLALYRAKEEGRNTFRIFDAAVDFHFDNARTLQMHLAETLAQDQLFLEYQPILDLVTGRVTGAEALLRWTLKDGTVVSPSVFVPMLESSGQITPVGNWVIEQSLKTVAALRSGISMAINLSVLQLSDRNLPDKIKQAISDNRIPSERIEFEITETSLLDNDSQKLAVLQEIKKFGCRISLDDFGTGFSSLRLLDEFPFDKLKIDGSFVRNGHDSPRRMPILQAMIRLGRELNLVVTAEGIESQEQADELKSLGCHEGQGFHFYRPVNEHELVKMFGANNKAEVNI